jgi:hypothetical protein
MLHVILLWARQGQVFYNVHAKFRYACMGAHDSEEGFVMGWFGENSFLDDVKQFESDYKQNSATVTKIHADLETIHSGHGTAAATTDLESTIQGMSKYQRLSASSGYNTEFHEKLETRIAQEPRIDAATKARLADDFEFYQSDVLADYVADMERYAKQSWASNCGFTIAFSAPGITHFQGDNSDATTQRIRKCLDVDNDHLSAIAFEYQLHMNENLIPKLQSTGMIKDETAKDLEARLAPPSKWMWPLSLMF